MPDEFIDQNAPEKGLFWLSWLLVPMILFVFLVALVLLNMNENQLIQNSYLGIQMDWFISINSYFLDWPDAVLSNLTSFGRANVLFLLVTPILFFSPRIWWAILGTLPLGLILPPILKSLAGVPRPFSVLGIDEIRTLREVGGKTLYYNSFPSGHTLTLFAVAIAILVSLFPRPKEKISYVIYLFSGLSIAAFLSLTRVAIGEHWPLDVIGGVVFGWIVGLSGVALGRVLHARWKFDEMVKGCLFLSLFFALIAYQEGLSTLNGDPYGDVVTVIASLIGLLSSLLLLQKCAKNYTLRRGQIEP